MYRPDAEKMQVSTIHSFCNRILREYGEYHDLCANFDILRGQPTHLHKIPLLQAGLNKYIKMKEAPDVISFFNECSENCIDPDELKETLKENIQK